VAHGEGHGAARSSMQVTLQVRYSPDGTASNVVVDQGIEDAGVECDLLESKECRVA
jgi:hypothetical protein